MKQQMRGLTSIKLRTGAILAALALVAAVIVSLLHHQPAHALSLDADLKLQGVTEPVNRLLRNDKPPQPVVEPPRQPAAPVTKNPRPQSNAAPAPRPSSPRTVAAQPMSSPQIKHTNATPIERPTPAASPLRAVEPIAVDKNIGRDTSIFDYAAQFGRVQAIASVPLSSPASVPLQATGDGWQVYGIVWYWWFLIGLVIYATLYAGMQLSRAPVQ